VKRLIFAIALFTACRSGGAPAGAEPAVVAADAEVQAGAEGTKACTVPVPANSGEWKLVEATGFTFCVPSSWRVSSTRASYSGGNIRWQSGAERLPFTVQSGGPGRMTSTSIANGGSSSAGTTMARRETFSEMIGGQMASLSREEGTGRVATGVGFRDPPVYFTGEASGQENVQLQIAVYRTIRFNR
jgi:hypothetical protein